MESAELIAILHEVRDRVRARNPETSPAGAGIPLPDLMPLVHARDAALGKVAAIGTVNPRRGGLVNCAGAGLEAAGGARAGLARARAGGVQPQGGGLRGRRHRSARDQNRALCEMGNRLDDGLAGMSRRPTTVSPKWATDWTMRIRARRLAAMAQELGA